MTTKMVKWNMWMKLFQENTSLKRQRISKLPLWRIKMRRPIVGLTCNELDKENLPKQFINEAYINSVIRAGGLSHHSSNHK